MPTKPTKKVPTKPSHELLADLFAAAHVIHEVAEREHEEAAANRRPGAYYDPRENFTRQMRATCEQLEGLEVDFRRTMRANGIEVKP